MRSVRHLKGEIFGVVLCAVLVLSVYAGLVGLASDLLGRDFIEALSVSSKVRLDGGNRFVMGDTLTVSARVKHGNVYSLTIYDGSGRLVFGDGGAVNGGGVLVAVPLCPPTFNSSRVYNLSLAVGVSNLPIPGVIAYDFSPSELFTVVQSLTNLNLTDSYDQGTHELRSFAWLTTSQGLPVENATVSFYIQPNVDFVRPDRGWTFLESVETDAGGFASYSCALAIMGGLHGLEAKFVGDENFGSSVATSEFNVSHRSTVLRIVGAEAAAGSASVVLQLTDPSGFPLGGKMLSFEAPAVTARALNAVTNGTGYAVVKFPAPTQGYVDSKITVGEDDYISPYQTNVRLAQNGSAMSVVSEWGESGTGSLAVGEEDKPAANAAVFLASQARALDSSLFDISVKANDTPAYADFPERMDSSFISDDCYSNVTFSYYLNGNLNYSVQGTRSGPTGGLGVYRYRASFVWYPDVLGNYSVDVVAADGYGNEITSGSLAGGLTVMPAYCNIVVYYPGAFCGSSMSILVAFSKSRTQDSSSDGSGYFQTVDYAPTVQWNNETYALDQPTQAPICLFINGVQTNLTTDGSGLCSYAYSIPTLPSSLNVTAIVDPNSRFNGSTLSQVFNLSSVSVRDDPTVAANPQTFYMNYSMSVLNGTYTTYLNASNAVETTVTAFNRSAYNVPAFFVAGQLGTRVANAAGFLNIPGGNYTYLRVVSPCNFTSTVSNPWADVDRNGKVEMKDVGLISRALYKSFGGAGYNWTLDLNADGKIDMKDQGIVNRDFGHVAYYLPGGAYSPNFDCGGLDVNSSMGPVVLDGRGFAWVPQGAAWLNLSCKADVEFFSNVSNALAVTDNSGSAGVTWNAAGGEGVYAAENRLAAPLNLTVAVGGVPGQMNASVSGAGYYYVFKKPVDLSVSWDSQPQATVLDISNDTYADSLANGTNFGGYSYLKVGGNGEYIGFVLFNLSAVPANAWVVSARLNVYEYNHYSTPSSYGVHRISDPWDEFNLTYSHMPSYAQNASYVLSNVPSQAEMWLSFDVTSDVRYWSNTSNANYGFALVQEPPSASFVWLRSNDSGGPRPSLEVSYLDGSQHVSVSAYDETRQQPAQVSVNFTVNDVWNANAWTNASGLWDRGAWQPSTGGTWKLGAVSSATWEYKSGTTSSVFALGLPTSLVSLDGNLTSVSRSSVVSNFTFFSSGLFGVGGVTVSFFVNGTFLDGTVYSCAGTNTTIADGTVRFGWNADHGTFSVHAVFGGDVDHAPCDAYELVVYNTTALSVLFSVSPAEFTPGTLITLNATLIDPQDGSLYTEHNVNVEFFNYSSSGSIRTMGCNASVNSVALYSLVYPNDSCAYAYNATVLNCTDNAGTVSNVASSPVQLTVGQPFNLSSYPIINMTSTSRELEYYFGHNGKNMNVPGKQIQVKINDTGYNCTTDPDACGTAILEADFPVVNNSTTTYVITATFAGDNPVSATANSKQFDGTSYASCTTIQYNGYEPSSNIIVLTVGPQSITSTNQTVTPHEVQNYIDVWTTPGGGWFTWFKMHVRVHVDWLNLTISAWVGFPIGAGIDDCSGLENTFVGAYDGVADSAMNVTQGAVINGITTATAALVTGWLSTIATGGPEDPMYWLALTGYIVAMMTSIELVHAVANTRSILLGVGGALIGFVIGMYSMSFISNWWVSASLALSGGSTLQMAAAKATVNYLGSSAIKQLACILGIACWLEVPFNIATAGLGAFAIYLAASEG